MALTYFRVLLVISASVAIGQAQQQDFPGIPAGRDYPVFRDGAFPRGFPEAFRHPQAYSNYPNYGRSPSVVSTDRRRQFGRTNAANQVSSVVRRADR